MVQKLGKIMIAKFYSSFGNSVSTGLRQCIRKEFCSCSSTLFLVLFMLVHTSFLFAEADFSPEQEATSTNPQQLIPVSQDSALSCGFTSSSHTFDPKRNCYQVGPREILSGFFGVKNNKEVTQVVQLFTLPGVEIALGEKNLIPQVADDYANEAVRYDVKIATAEKFAVSVKTPAALDAPYTLIEAKISKELVSPSCAIAMCVDEAVLPPAPICRLRVTSSTPPLCNTNGVNLTFSAAESTSLISDGLSYQFSTTCSQATLTRKSIGTDISLVVSPSTGESCSTSVTVTDSLKQSSSCTIDHELPDCLASDQCVTPEGTVSAYDICGVCDGDGSSCLTCKTVDVTSIQMTSELHLRSAAERLRSLFLKIEDRYKKRNLLRSHLAGMLWRKVNRLNTREVAAIQVLWIPPSLISLCTGPQINTCSVDQYDETVTLFQEKIKLIRKGSRYNARGFFKRRIYDLLRNRGLSPEEARSRSVRRVRRVRQDVRTALKQALATFKEIPAQNFSCEGLTSS